MKVVILAGGYGTRLSEETDRKPKPMVEVGNNPILWHIMKYYSTYGFNDFVICLGYKGYVIKEYFFHYFLHQSDVHIDVKKRETSFLDERVDPWQITLAETGLNTNTGGRIKQIRKYIGKERFLMTYGDGLSSININELVSFHEKKGKLATVSAVQPAGRFGSLQLDDENLVTSFIEKPKGDNSWINGGFFVLEPDIFDYIEDDDTVWEKKPMERLAIDKQLSSFCHNGFWRPMDTLRDKYELEKLWSTGDAPWKVW